MKEKKSVVLIVILVTLIILLGGLNVYQFLNQKDSDVSVIEENYLTLVKGYKVKVENKDAKLIEKNDDYALYNDNGLILYKFNTGEKTEVNIDIEDIDDMYVNFSSNGFVYNINEDSGFYNFETKSIMLKNKFEKLYPLLDEFDDVTNYLVARNNNKFYIIDGNTGKITITEDEPQDDFYHKDAIVVSRYSEKFNKPISFITYTFSTGDTGGGYHEYGYTLYDEQGNIVVKLEDDEFYSFNNWNDLVIYKEK